MSKIKVLQVDQWTSTGSVDKVPFDEFVADARGAGSKVHGGDADTVKAIFGGSYEVLEVEDTASPSLGYVWYTRGADGFPKAYKYNYDSSD